MIDPRWEKKRGGRSLHPHGVYSTTSVMTPEPTVLPPSRMAKWLPMSRATGLSRLTATAALSPGITISIPSGRLHFAGDVRGPEEELRLVTAEERRVPAAFVLAQDVDLTLELRAEAGSCEERQSPGLAGSGRS